MELFCFYKLATIGIAGALTASCGESSNPSTETAAADQKIVSTTDLQQSQMQLERTKGAISLGERVAEERALEVGTAMAVVEADQIVGALCTQYNLLNINQMTKLAEVIRNKSNMIGSPDIMSRPEYEQVRKDGMYKGLSLEAQNKLD